MTLRSRLTAAFLLVVLVPVVIGATLVARNVPRQADREALARLTSAQDGVRQALQDLCRLARGAAENLAVSYANGGRAAAQQAVDHGLATIAVLQDAAGRTVASAGPVPRTTTGGPTLSDCASGATIASPMVAASVPLRLADRSPAGAAWAGWQLGDTMRRLAGQNGVAITLAGDGTIVASTLPYQAASDLLGQPVGTSRAGSLLVAASLPAAGQPYRVLVSTKAPNHTPIYLAAGGLILLALLIGIVVVMLVTRALAGPIAEVGAAAAQVAAGNLDVRLPVDRADDIGRLAESFNVMTAELARYVGALRADRDQVRRNLGRLGETLSSTHDMDRILRVVLETSMAAIGATGGLIFLSADGVLSSVLAQGLAGEPRRRNVPIGAGVVGQVAHSGVPVRGRRGEPGIQPADGEPAASTFVAVPLRSTGQPLGVLALYDRAGGEDFDPGDVETIQSFASQAAVAVENVLQHQEAQRLSLTDGLTGLWNYRYFQMSLTREIERAARFERPLALLLLDLDRFKLVNDTYGHQRGDRVLVELSGRIKTEIREVDVLARYGGEEFVVILPETDGAGAERLAERVCEVIRRTPVRAGDGLTLPISVSIGAAVFPVHGTTAGELVDRADDALYDAKSAGRDTWRMYESGPDPPADPTDVPPAGRPTEPTADPAEGQLPKQAAAAVPPASEPSTR